MKLAQDDVLRITREFHERLAEIYGERLTAVYLYGSYARGEANDDSDIDVAVVLTGTVKRSAEEKKIIDIIAEISLREKCFLLPFFLSEDEYREKPYAIFRSIAHEGIPV